MKKWLPNWRMFSLFSFLALFLAGCGEANLSALRPVGEVADMQLSLIVLSTVIMTLVVLVVTIIFIYVVVKFRQREGDEEFIPKQVEGSHKLEVIWTVIPILLLLILAVPTVSYTFKLADVTPMEDEEQDALVVNVTAHLYWWEFEYPDYGVVTAQDLVVPTDERVYFNLKASDVKHSFWIPTAGGKMDTNTDNVNQMWLSFDSDRSAAAENLLYGKCAELCGPSHALMDFKVQTMSRAEFEQWIESMQNVEHTTPDTELAQAGEAIYAQSCIGCHAISGTQGSIGPNLANFGDRSRIAGVLDHTEEDLYNWLDDPETYKPANKMTGMYPKLNPNELDALVEYLMGLKLE